MDNIKPMENHKENMRSRILNETDPYIIIGVHDDAPFEEINKLYKALAKDFHPDRFSKASPQERKEIETVFTKITTAFNLLKDPEARKKFDTEKKMRLEREEILKNIQSQEKTGFNPFQTQPGSINLHSIFTDKKVDTQDIKNKKAEKLYHSSLTKYNNGELDAAISDLQAAIELNGKIARYHSSLGLAMKAKGWEGYAMAEFKIALNFDPNDSIALESYKPVKTTPLNNKTAPINKEQPELKKEKANGILEKVKNLFKKS
jgi:curved DNA-binding protein CbpA